MIQKSPNSSLLNLSDSLINELVECLLKPLGSKIWLQKVVNLLKQILTAKEVVLFTYADNACVFASEDLHLSNPKLLNQIELQTDGQDESQNIKPFFVEEIYVVPLSTEGRLHIFWDKRPDNSELENYNNVLNLLLASFITRANFISTSTSLALGENLEKCKNLLSEKKDLKSRVSNIAEEIVSLLDVSRCQIKFFSQDIKLAYDGLLSTEYVLPSFVDAISVIPSSELEWLKIIHSGENILLMQKQDKFIDSIESLLSIKSILGCSLVYNGNPIGVIILHQCDYERNWKPEEISYVKNVALILGLAVGIELEISKRYQGEHSDLNTGLINPDQFLREINHFQINSQVNKKPFSLLMIDIEKLKDINLSMGFVAGNLVLSQTARYLKRLYGSQYTIARYNNDEFVIVLEDTDQNKAKLEAEKLKDHLSNISVFGIGTIDYNFSFVTYPLHSESIAELLTLLEQAMVLSKSRGKFQISSFDEIKNLPKDNWERLLTTAIPEIILRRASLKTGPEIIEAINKQIKDSWQMKTYSADILDSVQSLALALDAKDSYTEGHSKRVSEYAYLLAKELGLDLQEIEWIRLAAGMHDIGKIGIPENILCKPGKLTKEEYEVMKKHPLIGAKILKPIKPLEKVATLVLYHHEYWDGAGYPNGLSKEDIPVGARIVSIVDAFQAMTSNRPYRSSLQFEEAINRLRDGKEKQWEPDLVELFIKIVSK